jgi:hypothetical protein
MEFNRETEIRQIKTNRPHVVLLGAGASQAAFPEGDANGRRVPVMNDLIEVLGLRDLLRPEGVLFEGRNFEDVYAHIHAHEELRSLRDTLESRIYSYFASLRIPEEPTIYDYLVLCLRDKDVIATFNWDPFLVQAYRRNRHAFALPQILFLHGNVMVAFCPDDRVLGPKAVSENNCTNYFFC